MLAIRLSKIACLGALTLYVGLVAINNVFDYSTNLAFVTHVLDMDKVFPDNSLRWRALTSPLVHHLSYILIIATEFLVAGLIALGLRAMVRARKGEARAFNRAKSRAVFGLTLGFLLYEAGFIAIGGEWFSMWEAEAFNGVQSAFRVAATMLGVLIFVSMKDEELF